MKDSIKYLVASSKIGFLICLFLLIGEVAHAQETWLGVTGIAQYNSTTNAYRWNFGANGLFSPYDLFLQKADSSSYIQNQVLTPQIGGFNVVNGIVETQLNIGEGDVNNRLSITPNQISMRDSLNNVAFAMNGLGLSVSNYISGSAFQVLLNPTVVSIATGKPLVFDDEASMSADPVNPLDIATKQYVDGLFNSSGSSTLITREVPSGVQNGINEVFILANTPKPGSESVFLNGVLQDEGVGEDYIISGSTITFLSTIQPTDKIRVNYSII